MHPDQPAPVSGLTHEQAQRWAAVQPEDNARILVGDCPERAAVVAGLRTLAGYLAANPAVPVPRYGCEVPVHAEGTDSEQFSQVDLVGEIIGERRLTGEPLPGITTPSVPSGRSPTGSSASRNGGWPSTRRGRRTRTRWCRTSPRQSQLAWPPPRSPTARRPSPRPPGSPRPAAARRAAAAAPPRGGTMTTIRAACRRPAAADSGAHRSAPLLAYHHRWPARRCGPGLAAEARP